MSTTTKKPVKRTATKKLAHKRASATSASKTTVHTTKTPAVKSFHASRPVDPFFTFRISHQTLYWLVLAILVIGLATWVLIISIRVQHIYDEIDTTSSQNFDLPYPPHSSTQAN